ncbi:hypothetical protein D0862_09308 [Hortaea werneckii]|uniref:Aminoglycoside phosphotransferase domain-containing protein n=1 Tax=Hortaea werneckii TaxID=91943 RepID=A0A3M7FWA0_HORWE|nr:hypothetical protein D0862_09308 [Hortaea werneckii]
MTLSLSGGETFSLSAATKNERNILSRLQRSHATEQLRQDLWGERTRIEALVANHLRRMSPSACTVQPTNTWFKGQFNICVVVHIQLGDQTLSKMIFRCPMAHKVGEQYTPGSVDEKMRTEVATYAWIEANCPEIPIPCLRGFGFSRSLQFTRRANGTGYDSDPSDSKFERPYMLLDYIGDKGTMLSQTLKKFRDADPDRLQNLLRGISRIMISLASKAQSRIGSLRFSDDGSIELGNRPLFCANTILESEGAPKVVNRTYATEGHFIDDMLRFREESFRAQPNAVNDEEDCRLQMFHMVLLRRMKAHFADRHYQGPFVLQFTDFHASNIFVDDEWNIVSLIDLEFVCALPPSMLSAPYWLTVDAMDEISDRIDAYGRLHQLFTSTLRRYQQRLRHEHNVDLALAVESAWETYAYWFYGCFTSINCMPCCVEDHLYKKFRFEPSPDEELRYARILSSRWSSDPDAFVKQKLCDKAKYNDDLALLFDREQDAKGGKVLA